MTNGRFICCTVWIVALSTMGVMRPKQEVPYQNIQVELIG